LINVLLGSLVIPIAFVTTQKTLRHSGAAAGVCALIAAMPELYIDTARVGNQTLAMILYGVFGLLCLKVMDGEEYLPLTGIVQGLLLLTKAYGLAAIPALIIVVVQAVRSAQSGKRSGVLLSSAVAL